MLLKNVHRVGQRHHLEVEMPVRMKGDRPGTRGPQARGLCDLENMSSVVGKAGQALMPAAGRLVETWSPQVSPGKGQNRGPASIKPALKKEQTLWAEDSSS